LFVLSLSFTLTTEQMKPTLPARPTFLSLAVSQALLASLPVAAQDTTLPQVVVTAPGVRNNSASVGSFGNTPLLDTPAAINVVTTEQLQDAGSHTTTGITRFDASVNEAYNAVGYAEQFSVRGFALDNATSYRKDGLPITSDASIPLENKERVELLKGLAGLQAGIATPGGILNYVTKRPTDTPVRSVTLEASERGTLYGAVDLGGRFDDQRFGYRINAAAERLRSYVKGADGERQFVSGAFDWRLTPQALLQLDLDYQHKSQVSVPGFQLINGTDLPTGIAADTMLNNQPWTKPVRTDSFNVGLNFSYQLNDDWKASLAVNRHHFRRDDFAAFPYGCAAAGLFPGFCANGDYDVYDYQSENESKTLLAGQAQLQGKFATGTMQHQLTAGVSLSRRRDYFGDCVYGTLDCAGSAANGTSNIYQPVTVPASTIAPGPVQLRRKDNEDAVYVQDVLALSSAVKLHAGVRYARVERSQFDTAGALNARYDHGYALPNVALVLHPQDNWTVYGSFSQGLEHGGIAPLLTTNVNQMLDPSKSRQWELGTKAELAQGLRLSAALFQITKPLEYTDAGFTYVRNGEAVHRGIELAAQGQFTRGLTTGISLTALDARQRGTGEATLDDKRVTNVPSFKSLVYADYAVAALPGVAVTGRWNYASAKAFNPDNSVKVPAYHVFDLGARYVMRVAGKPTTLRLQVDNVFDKFYWRDVTQSLGGYLFPGAPRTVKLSAQFDL
jgi:iron complex outermembrane recepter protein